MSATRRTALVTGGARGIGRGIVEDLAQDHHVALHYNTTAPAWAGPDIALVQGDLTAPDGPADVVARALAGLGRLDVIVNNAGQIISAPFDSADLETSREMFEVNLFAPHALLAAALPHLARGAAIVNIGSMNAQFPPRGAALYGASKAALQNWTRAAAKELGPRGIRVNAVAPGAIETPEAPRDIGLQQAFLEMTAMGRLGTPADIAGAVRFLASDAASFITGEVLTVSGGYRL